MTSRNARVVTNRRCWLWAIRPRSGSVSSALSLAEPRIRGINTRPTGDLTLAYEALRAQATGQLPATTPRGLALFLAAGCPSWMKAWTPLMVAVLKPPTAAHRRGPSVGLGGGVVQLLTDMAFGCQREWTA